MFEKTVVITGGAKGIGLSSAKLFSSNNYNVVIIDNDIYSLNRVSGFKVDKYYCDISDYEQLKKCCYNIINKYTNIDIIINNAGIQISDTFLNYDYTNWKKIMDINYFGVCNIISNFIPFIKCGGTILNILSVHSSIPRKNKYAYDSSKSAIEILTKELALEFAKDGITINGLSFGAVDTDMNDIWRNNIIEKEIALNKVPLKIIFKPEEIANFAYTIINNFSKYTTGSIFIIDGGRSLI